MSIILIYTTCPDLYSAEQIAEALVSDRIVSCANILPEHKSIYRWDGDIQKETEVVALFKTTEDRWQQAHDKIKELHSYEVPCILKLPVSDGHPAFIRWIEDQTA